MRYLILLILFTNCSYYFYPDATLYKLTEQEKQIFNSKKILYIGFDYLEIRRIRVSEILYQDKVVTNKEHLKIIEFLNSKEINKSVTSFQKNYYSSKGADTIDEGYLSKKFDFQSYELNPTKLNQFVKGENENIEEKNLKEFLINYLKFTKHLGLYKMNSTLAIKDSEIKFNLQDFDYVLVGFGKEIKNPNISNDMGKLVLLAYSNIISVGTLGVYPMYLYSAFQSNLYLYDKKLNLIKKSESEILIPSLSSVWMFLFSNSNDYEKKAHAKDISQFLKESVDGIK